MIYIGIDVHKKMCVATIKGAGKEILDTVEFSNTENGILRFVDRMKRHEERCVAVCESTGNHWIRLHDILEEHGIDTKLVHPEKTKAIAWARLKNDKVDSEVLTDLLRLDMIYESYVPDKTYRDLRELTRSRLKIVHERTKTKNKVRAILVKYGHRPPTTNIFSNRSLKWLEEIDVSRTDRKILDMYVESAKLHTIHIQSLEEDIAASCSNNRNARLLMTIPGISHITALTIIAEVVDVKRFSNAEKLVSAAGLAPSQRSSGQTMHRGRITKKGSAWLRNAIVNAATVAMRHDERMKKTYTRLWPRIGKQKAKVAVARHILEICWHMMTNGTEYRTQNPKITERKYKRLDNYHKTT